MSLLVGEREAIRQALSIWKYIKTAITLHIILSRAYNSVWFAQYVQIYESALIIVEYRYSHYLSGETVEEAIIITIWTKAHEETDSQESEQ